MTKIRVSKIRVSEIRVSKIRVSKIRVREIRVSEIRVREIRVREIRVSEIRISSNHCELHGAVFLLTSAFFRYLKHVMQDCFISFMPFSLKLKFTFTEI